MKKRLHIFLLAMTSCLMAVACRENGSENDCTGTDGVCVDVQSPVYGDGNTKALSCDFSFKFMEDDRISVFSASGDDYLTYHLTASAGTPGRAYFLTEDFKLKDGRYYAMYPAATGVCAPDRIELPFTGQAQEGNNTTSHLSKYDYCRASSDISGNSGHFSFAHLVSWLKICIPAGTNNDSFKGLSISADEGIAVSQTLNIRTGEISGTRNGDSDKLYISIGPEEGVKLENDDTLVVYVTIPADSYTGLTVRTYDTEEGFYEYVFSGTHEFLNGHYYLVNVGNSDVTDIRDLDGFGLYRCHGDGMVYSWEPSVTYTEGTGQISWYHSPSRTRFDFFKLGTRDFMTFIVESGDIKENGTYGTSIHSSTGTICTDAGFEAVKTTSSAVWLLNRELGLGCIIKTDE